MKTERRYSFSSDTRNEFRAKIEESSDDKSRLIRGYGIVFNQKSKIITEYIPDKGEYRTFYEIISPTALDNILRDINKYDVILSINHRFDEVLARTSSGTLKLTKDDKGVMYETELPDTSRGEDVLQMVLRGDYYESSFQFVIADGGDSWTFDASTGLYTRTINNIETLIDVTVASYRGAYSNTSIQIVDNKRTEFVEYEDKDIQVVRTKLNELISSRTEEKVEEPVDESYKIELELDKDKLKMLEV